MVIQVKKTGNEAYYIYLSANINSVAMSLSFQNKESELSYAYLHAIAGKAGMSCKIGDRHDDANGVDAEVNFRGITGHSYLTHVQFNVQLKATVDSPGNYPDHVTYFLKGVNRYDKLRTNDSPLYKILVVLYLPADQTQWLQCNEEQLIMKNCAYWTCLYGAEASANISGETIFIPKTNLLTPEELIRLANLAAFSTVPIYNRP